MSIQNNQQNILDTNSFIEDSHLYGPDAEGGHIDRKDHQTFLEDNFGKYKASIQSIPLADQSQNQPLESDQNDLQQPNQLLNIHNECIQGPIHPSGNHNCNLESSFPLMNDSFVQIEGLNDPDISDCQIYKNLDCLLNSGLGQTEGLNCKLNQKESNTSEYEIHNLIEGINHPPYKAGLLLDNKNENEEDSKAFLKIDHNKSNEDLDSKLQFLNDSNKDLRQTLNLEHITANERIKNLLYKLPLENVNRIDGKSSNYQGRDISESQNLKLPEKDLFKAAFEISKSHIVGKFALFNSIDNIQNITEPLHEQATTTPIAHRVVQNTTSIQQAIVTSNINENLNKSNTETIDFQTTQIQKDNKNHARKILDDEIRCSDNSNTNKPRDPSNMCKMIDKTKPPIVDDNQNEYMNDPAKTGLENIEASSSVYKIYNVNLEIEKNNYCNQNAGYIKTHSSDGKVENNKCPSKIHQASLSMPYQLINSFESPRYSHQMIDTKIALDNLGREENPKDSQSTKPNQNLPIEIGNQPNSNDKKQLTILPDQSEKINGLLDSNLKNDKSGQSQSKLHGALSIQKDVIRNNFYDKPNEWNNIASHPELLTLSDSHIKEISQTEIHEERMTDSISIDDKIQNSNFKCKDVIDVNMNAKKSNEVFGGQSFAFNANNVIHFVEKIEALENGYFVDQYQIAEVELIKLSNLISEGPNNQLIQYDNCNKIFMNFNELLKLQAKFTGIFGRLQLVIKCLSQNRFIKDSENHLWESHFRSNGPGLYLIPLAQQPQELKFLIILYSDDDDFNYVNNKKGIIQLLRYMTQLCPMNILAIDKLDIDLISFESQTQKNWAKRFVPQTIKKENDKCELVDESSFEVDTAFERLIGKGNYVGFYTKKYFEKQSASRISTFEWKNLSEYNKFFSKVSVNTDDLQKPICVDFMNKFLREKFYVDFCKIENSIKSQLTEYLETNKEHIQKQINYELDVKKCFYAIQTIRMLSFCKFELFLKMDLAKYFENTLAMKIDRALEINEQISDKERELLGELSDCVKSSVLLKTEEIALRHLIEKTEELKGFDIEEHLSFGKTISKPTLYTLIAQKGNQTLPRLKKLIRNWDKFEILFKVCEITDSKSFCEKYHEILLNDTKEIFLKIFENVHKYIDFEFSLSQIKADIEKRKLIKIRESHYFEELKKRLERTNGPTNVYINSVTSVKTNWLKAEKIVISYEEEQVIEAYNEFDIYQFRMSKEDGERACQDHNLLIKPKCEKIITITLPESFEVVDFFFVKNTMLAVIINKLDTSKLKFYNILKPRDNPIIYSFGHKICKVDYNESENKMIFYTIIDSSPSIILYFISDNFLIRDDATIYLESRFGIKEIKSMRFGKLNEIFLIDSENTIRKIDYKSLTAEKIDSKYGDITDMVFITNTNCLLLISTTRVIPYIVNTKTFLPEILFNEKLDNFNFILAKFDSQIQLMFNRENKIHTKVLNCVSSTENYGLVECSTGDKSKVKNEKSLSVFDYLEFMNEKYSIHYPLQELDMQSLSQSLMIYLIGYQNNDKTIKPKIFKKLEEIQTNVKKPYVQEMGLLSNAILLFADDDNEKLLNQKYCLKSLNQWIQELICLVPTQISRCENSQYMILNKGLPMKFDDSNTLYDVKDKINFGVYESIFNDWDKNIKVITSMGKQSTGKSYTLNHLSGSTFFISGGRCTDGCWLSIKITDDCLYVLMDFEGLGSFERSEQEDMLLSIQNASISNFTIFKAEASINRETDKMFHRFNQGANMLKGDDKIFQGTFCIMIKDISKNEVDNITNEFKQKMEVIIERENEKNFISTMYKSGYLIWPFPPLTNDNYYEQMGELANIIKNEIQPTFTNGKDFLNMLKTIMAKMSIEDFTSLNQQEINHRIHILNQLYIEAFTFGKLSNANDPKKTWTLKSLDTTSKQIDEEVTINLQLSSDENLCFIYQDIEINLDNGSKDFIHILNRNFEKTFSNHLQWSNVLKSFVKQAMEKRIERVLQWVDLNLEKWSQAPDFNDIITNFKSVVSYKGKEIQTINQICKNICEFCNSTCALLMNHSEKHACESLNHKCSELCFYCLNDNISINCGLAFGHNEKHACSDQQHTCGLNCKYEMCRNKCVEKTGHEGEHKCGLKQHNCVYNCSLQQCQNRCQISAEKEHTVHKCINDQCMEKCEVQNCKMRCICNNHFHGEPELSSIFKYENQIQTTTDFFIGENETINCDFHCCGNDHLCEEMCSKHGYCHVMSERKVVEKEFYGQRDTFHYQKQFEYIGTKKKCCINISKFKRTHEGNHTHTLNETFIHSCTEHCPKCNNICEKGFGHTGKHHTTHGNMEKYYFVANQNDFDIGDHKYVIGESSVAEMCNMFCNKLGRGHIHVIPCEKTKGDCNNIEKGKRRHETCQYGPDVEITKDEIKHEAYWDLINFEDPCQQLDIETFSKCPYYCGHEDHKNDDEQHYCQLDLWHDKVKSLYDVNKTTGTISFDGHYFKCSHNLRNGYHFVLCLDDSGSMSGQPWDHLKNAVETFCLSRKNFVTDRLTIILFDSDSRITCENIQFDQFDVEKHLIYKGGDTNFARAIVQATEVYENNLNDSSIPIFILMSDGRCDNGNNEILQLKDKFKSKELRLFFIGFQSNSILDWFRLKIDFAQLKEFASITGGEYVSSIDGVSLKENFRQISSKFGTTISIMKARK